jgi:hypothetical protein
MINGVIREGIICRYVSNVPMYAHIHKIYVFNFNIWSSLPPNFFWPKEAPRILVCFWKETIHAK